MFTSQITEIPGFRVTQTIGAGSAGWVYQARRIEDGLVVALKVLRPEAQADPEQVARFRREQLLLQKLESPYLVRFIQADLESTPVWIATELLEGGSLAVRLRPKTDRKSVV
jgi:serine/threonine protein kinase